MRVLLIFLAIALSTPAIAQAPAERPDEPAPAASESFERRETWCQEYAAWLIERTPAANVAPSDVAPTHRYEIEFNSCKLDPQQYERDTLAEIARGR